MEVGGRTFTKCEYFFDDSVEGAYPDNLRAVLGLGPSANLRDPNNLRVGVTCYHGFYSSKEMDDMENKIM